MSDVIIRNNSLRSSNSFAVGTSAVQVSGGPSSDWPLTAVSPTFYPSYHRQTLRICNNSTTATLYVGSAGTVTASSGWIKEIGPGQYWDDNTNGSIPRWLIASAASAPVTMEEYS
jgi:hypothetical protein